MKQFIETLRTVVWPALEAMGADVYGIGRYLTTSATKATSTGSEVAVTDYTITADIPAGRVVEFVARVNLITTVAGDQVRLNLRQGSVAGSQFGTQTEHLPASTTGYQRTFAFPWRSSGGTFTWVLTFQRISGTGSCTCTVPGVIAPGIFYVRDIVTDTAFTII